MYLMQDILDLSKIEAGKVHVQLSRIDLHDLVKNAMAIIEPQARAKNLEHVPQRGPEGCPSSCRGTRSSSARSF